MINDQPIIYQPIKEIEDIDINNNPIQQIEEDTNSYELSQEEKLNLIKSEIPSESQKYLGALIELDQISRVLERIDSTENQDRRKKYIDVINEIFVSERMKNSAELEKIQKILIDKILQNIETLDTETMIEALAKFRELGLMEANRSINTITQPQTAIQVNVGNNNQENVNTSTVVSPIPNLKEIKNLNDTLKDGWNGPRKEN